MTHTHTHIHTLGRTPLVEGLAHRSVLYLLNTKHRLKTDIHALGGIRIFCPSKQAAAVLALDQLANEIGYYVK
jgi:hypothetical protein